MKIMFSVVLSLTNFIKMHILICASLCIFMSFSKFWFCHLSSAVALPVFPTISFLLWFLFFHPCQHFILPNFNESVFNLMYEIQHLLWYLLAFRWLLGRCASSYVYWLLVFFRLIAVRIFAQLSYGFVCLFRIESWDGFIHLDILYL